MLENLNHYKFILTALNLLILYFVLRKILFKPVTEFMEKRTNGIKDAIANADKSKADAAELKQKYEEQLRSAREEADRILNDARARGNKEHETILTSAKQDAETVMVKAREEIERERAQMLKEVKGQVAGLALIIAGKLVEANMDTAGNRVLVDKFIDEAGAA